MRSPRRTLHSSIFEPLYTRADEELHFQPTKPLQSDWLPQGHISPSPAASSAPPHPNMGCPTMRRAAATIFNHNARDDSCSGRAGECSNDHNSITYDHHSSLGMHYSPNFGNSSAAITQPTSTQSCPPSRSRSSSDVVDCADDGSIASKLLGSITKSISSPSLLTCCKESVRETPYQKALRLKEMKLQHCAEELGSESSDGRLLSNGGYDSIFDSSSSMMGALERSTQRPSTEITSEAYPKSEGNPTPAMISVRSSPNLRCTTSLLSKTKERSFPPPLTHTLPRSNSSDSFSYSLRSYREGGHFLLKEVKVPCRQYFQSSRKDGRLTLRLFTTDENSERQYSEEDEKDCKELQAVVKVGMHQATSDGRGNAALLDGGTSERIEVESTNGASYVGEAQVCRVKESKKIDLGMSSTGDKDADAERFRLRSALNSLHIATLSNDSSARSKKVKINVTSHNGTLSRVDFDFTAANRKACTVSCVSLSNQHLLPGQQPLNHAPENCPCKLQMGRESNATRVSACGAGFGMELRGAGASNGGAKMIFSQGAEVQPLGCSSMHRPAGYGLSKSKAASMIIFKDVNAAKCLMENMSSKLMATFGNLDEGKWSYGEEDKKRSRERDSSAVSTDVIKDSSMYHGIKSINIGVREMEHNHHKANIINGVSFEVRYGRKSRRSSGAVRESSGDHMDGTCMAAESSRHPISSCHVTLQEVPSSIHSQAALQGKWQGKEWLHSLHCKEILYRNQLPGKGFMKLHCVA